jgi:ABC-type amino acid transport substrate-binding protein
VDKIIFHEKPVSMNKLHCMFSRKVPGIEKKIEAFNSGLEEIMNDGTYDKILVRHHLK